MFAKMIAFAKDECVRMKNDAALLKTTLVPSLQLAAKSAVVTAAKPATYTNAGAAIKAAAIASVKTETYINAGHVLADKASVAKTAVSNKVAPVLTKWEQEVAAAKEAKATKVAEAAK